MRSMLSRRLSRLRGVFGTKKPEHIIFCNEKSSSFFTIAFGSLFLVIGIVCSMLVMPDILAGKNFGGLSVLLFVFIGAGMNWRVYKNKKAYKYYGESPLHLNPHAPGLGGQLGGTFTVQASNGKNAPELKARLTCYRTRRVDNCKSVSIRWQGEAPVYRRLTAGGFEYSFIFNVPETGKSSRRSRIHWEVSVEDSAETPQKFDRSWTIPVVECSFDNNSSITIPKAFLDKAAQDTQVQANQSALDQIPVAQVDGFMEYKSKAGRHVKSVLSGVAFGAMFSGVGLFSVFDGWLPGYIVVAIGLTTILASIFLMGRAIDLRISREYEMIYTRRKIFGYVFSENSAELIDPSQFSVEVTSSSESGDMRTQWCAIFFDADEKKIKIAEGIEGEQAAYALMDNIIERCFDDTGKIAA